MNKKIITIVVITALIIIAIVIATSKNTETIKIGALYPMTGGLASYGEPAYQAAKIAIADINIAGGINGQMLELVVEDHECDPKVVVSAYNKLVQADKIHVLTSVACTGTVLALAPNLEKDETVLLGTVTSGNKLTNVSPNFFRNWASDRLESSLLADQITSKGYKNIVTLYEETDYAKGLVVSLEDFLKDSDVKISKESFASSVTDVRTQLAKLQALKPDAVFISVQTVTSGEIVLKQMEQIGFKPKVLYVNDNILKASVLVEAHKDLLEGAIGGDYVFEISSKAQDVLNRYRDAYGMDCPQINICLAEYDAIRMLAEGFKEGKSALEVRDYLEEKEYKGLTGTITFDENNDRENAQYSLFVIKGGKAEVIK